MVHALVISIKGKERSIDIDITSPQLLQWYLSIKDTLKLVNLSTVERLSTFQR